MEREAVCYVNISSWERNVPLVPAAGNLRPGGLLFLEGGGGRACDDEGVINGQARGGGGG